MKWFGRKAAGRAEARPVLTRGFGWSPAGDDVPRSYEERVRAGYLSNPVVQRAVRLIADAIGGAAIEASEAVVLPLIKARSGGQVLTETLAMQLLLHGNAFVQVLPGADDTPGELFALRPERVTIEADARGWPAAYRYKAGEAATRLAAEDAKGRPAVIHIKAPHPLDDHYGLGPLQAASSAIAIHNAATRWNKALLDNAARPSGALVYDPPGEAGAALAPEQFTRLKDELEAGFQGSGNAGRPMLLEGGLRWQAMSLSPADMDFQGLKAMAAREIALAFGVPPMLMGLPGDATYANYREANRALWRQTILPMAAAIYDGIADGLKAWWPGLRIGIDLDTLPALSEDRERLWRQVSAADFLTLDEKRAMVGFGPVARDRGAAGSEPETDGEQPPTEVKFNSRHFRENGQFAPVGEGVEYGGSGGAATGIGTIKPAPLKANAVFIKVP